MQGVGTARRERGGGVYGEESRVESFLSGAWSFGKRPGCVCGFNVDHYFSRKSRGTRNTAFNIPRSRVVFERASGTDAARCSSFTRGNDYAPQRRQIYDRPLYIYAYIYSFCQHAPGLV